MQPRQNVQNKPKSSMLSLRLALAPSCVRSSWTAPSPRPFLSRAIAICLLQEHLLGVHKGHSVPLNPSGSAGSAVRRCLCADERLWQSCGFSKWGARGAKRQLPSLSGFSHYDFSLFSPRNCLFASGLSTQADSRAVSSRRERSAVRGGQPSPNPPTHAPCTHPPRSALSAKRSPHVGKKWRQSIRRILQTLPDTSLR